MLDKVKIYSAKVCPYAQRSRMVLLTKGIDFELVEIDLNHKPAWFTEISPYGKVPLLQNGDDILWESSIINEYLEECFPARPLLPTPPAERGMARIWIDFANTKLTPAFYKLILAQERQKQQEWGEELRNHLLFIEREGLQKRSQSGPYWLGESVSLIDLTFYPWFERWCVVEHYRGIAIPAECARLQQWCEAMQDIPAVQQTQQPPEFHITQYAKYANNTATGITAREMRRD